MSNFRVEINTEFKDNNRNFTIIDRKINEFKKGINFKYYKYHCNKCGAELWIDESNLLRGVGCGCCTNRRAVKGINDISTTNPELIKYFVNIEDCYTHTKCSHKRVLLKCPQCGYEKEMNIFNLYKNGFSCSQCCDGISYPEKFMFNLLKQLRIDFVYQFGKTNSKWCNKYRYDFHFNLNNEEYIIETHGEQHYEERFSRFSGQTLEQTQENDKNKYNLAINNGIKPKNYIVIDCRHSELDFIKNNIIHSKLNEIFNLANIDWNKIGQESEKNKVKEVCDYWHKHNDINDENLTTKDLEKILHLNRTTITKYLKKGKKFGWCNYDTQKEKKKSGLNKSKKIEMFKDGKSLGVFESANELERQSEELFGIKLFNGLIGDVARGKFKQYKGFIFKFC